MDFYYFPPSPPCRSVEMTAKALDIKLNKKMLDLMAGDQFHPDFAKINPQCCVPTMVDNGFVLWESRAILVYFAETYDKTGLLYPNESKVRAIINQRLYFDMGVFYKSYRNYYYPIMFRKLPGDPKKFKEVEAAFALLENFLKGKLYVADTKSYTIADIALVATMTSFESSGFDYSKYANVAKWYDNCKQVIPGYAEIVAPEKDFSHFMAKL